MQSNRQKLMNNINVLSKYGLFNDANVFFLKDKGKGKEIDKDGDMTIEMGNVTGCFIEVDFKKPIDTHVFIAQGINQEGALDGKYYVAKFGSNNLSNDKIIVSPEAIKLAFKDAATIKRIQPDWEYVEITGPYKEDDPALEDKDLKTFELIEKEEAPVKARMTVMQKLQSLFFSNKPAVTSISSTAQLNNSSLPRNSTMS